MFDILLNKIREESKLWAEEQSLYRRFLDRADIDESREEEILFCHGACAAIVRELKELEEDIVNYKSKYQQYYIYTEEKETNGKKWTRFYTLLFLVVKGEEGVGLQRKYVNVKINPLIDTTPYKDGGVFTLEIGKYSLPLIYEIKNLENGKKEYPCMYIHEIAAYTKLEGGK